MTILRLSLLVGLVALATPALADEVLTSATPIPAVREVPDHYELTDLRMRTDPPRIDLRLTAIKADGSAGIPTPAPKR